MRGYKSGTRREWALNMRDYIIEEVQVVPLKGSNTGTTLDAMTTCPVCSPGDDWVVLNLHYRLTENGELALSVIAASRIALQSECYLWHLGWKMTHPAHWSHWLQSLSVRPHWLTGG